MHPDTLCTCMHPVPGQADQSARLGTSLACTLVRNHIVFDIRMFFFFTVLIFFIFVLFSVLLFMFLFLKLLSCSLCRNITTREP